MKHLPFIAILCGLGCSLGHSQIPSSPSAANHAAPLTPDDVLSVKGGQFYLEGKPFAEISFNKYDLFWQLYNQLAEGKQLTATNPMVQAQSKALHNLHDLGFKTVRIFALPWGPAGPESYADPEKRKNLYAALDKTLDLCDAHDIRVVWSLAAGTFTDTKLDPAKGWVHGEEHTRELVADPDSRSRKLLYRYIDETVARYRHRKAVMMWEISNEVTLQADIGDGNRVYNGERMPTLKDVARFFDEVARRIRASDPLRLVCSGGSNMRESQWHLYQGAGWKPDTFEEQLKCFKLLYGNSAVDVIDIHSYPNNKPGYALKGKGTNVVWLDNQGYMAIAKRLGKPLMIGELGLHAIARTNTAIWSETPDYFESFDDTRAAKPWVVKTLNDVVEAGVPLTYWWCYQSDSADVQNNRQRFDIDRDRNPELVASIVEANKRLKEKLLAPPRSALSGRTPWADFNAPVDVTNGFTVRFTIDLKQFDGPRRVLGIPGVLDVWLRQHDPLDRSRQNYPAFKMPDGSVPVLEASLGLRSLEHPEWTNMTIGVPFAMLDKPIGKHEVTLSFTGPDWRMYVDGQLLDNDFPFGYPRWQETNTWALDGNHVRLAAIYFPVLPVEPASPAPAITDIQYWTPHGHNNWVGDVQTVYFQGRYHVFYLYDRRHHASKFGCGAHYFEHLSTADFKTWTEHEAATPLQEQWECIGTGVPFVLNNQLFLSYGWHTTRVYPQEKTTLPAQWDYLKQHGRTGSFNRTNTPGVPAGSTYSINTEGVAGFRKSGVMFHPCENPTVYSAPDGRLRMLANYRSRGTWESDSLDGGWRCVNPEFPPGGDCTVYFRWGKFDYILGGFTGMWSKSADAPDSAYEDVVRKGLDFYDGSNVPAVTEIPGHRFLMASWIPIRGWGGPLVIRELVQFPDGRIGSKWMEEITPATEKSAMRAAEITGNTNLPIGGRSFLLTFEVHPAEAKKGRFAVSFLPETGDHAACELQLRLEDLRAQFAAASSGQFAGTEKSLREGGAPQSAGNYAIENLVATDRAFTVRVLVKGDDKLGGSLIDAEIAGLRTMISYRPDLTVRKLNFRTDAVELRRVQVAPILADDLRPMRNSGIRSENSP